MMITKGQVALAVGAGYLLGRTRKMKAAMMLATAGATGRYPGGPRDLLERGARVLADSPEVARLGESIKDELMHAAKAAAMTAASGRIDSLNNRLRAGMEGAAGEAGDVVRKTARRVDGEEPDTAADEYDEPDAADEPEDDLVEEEPSDEASEPKRTSRRKPEARRRVSDNGETSRSRASTEHDDDEEDEAPARRKTRATAPTDSAPVRRTRK